MSLIEKLADFIEEHYLFPDIALKLAEHLQQTDYSGLGDEALGEAVTADMIRISHDQHLFFRYEPQEDNAEPDHEAIMQKHTEEARFRNFGFQKLERLSGNIAFVKLNELPPVFVAGKLFEAVIALLANMSAIIIDLQDCEGGAPDMVQFIASHFLEAEQPLSGIESDGGKKYTESHSLAGLNSPRLLEKPLAILISPKTFSAAEALAYDLQALKRAVIVGKMSRGGAHLSTFQAFENKFLLRCSIARALNPITDSNWEGTGVIPDIVSETAQVTAQKYLLEQLIAQEDELYKEEWQSALENLE